MCVRARACAHARLVTCAPVSDTVYLCACAWVGWWIHPSCLHMCPCVCACPCVRAHIRGRVDAPLRVLFVAHGRFSRGKPPPRCVESPPAARPRDAYHRLSTGVSHGPRTRVHARARVARAFRPAPMQCWAVLCAVFRRASDAPIGVDILNYFISFIFPDLFAFLLMRIRAL